MEGGEPSWKIRKRPCPFFAQGRCIFAKNCNFIHGEYNEVSNVAISLSECSQFAGNSFSEYYTAPTSGGSFLSDFIDNYDENDNEFSSDEEDYDCGSPTVRNAQAVDKGNINPLRDSVATVKADKHSESQEVKSAATMSYDRQRDLPKLSLIIPYPNAPVAPPKAQSLKEIGGESPSSGIAQTPASSSSAQVVEVQLVNGRVQTTLPVSFSLANATANSSLLANRLARSRARVVSEENPVPVPDPSTPFSAGELYASYEVDDATPVPSHSEISGSTQPHDSVHSSTSTSKNDFQEGSAQTASDIRTPSWLKPLRLASVLISSEGNVPSMSTGKKTLHETERRPSLPFSDSGSSYDSIIEARNSSSQAYSRRSSTSTTDIVASRFHPIVLSDPDGNESPISPPPQSIYNVDTSRLPPAPPLDIGVSGEDSFSPSSVSLTELMGGSPKRRPVSQALTIPENSSGAGSSSPSPRITGSLQLTLQRRAERIRESALLLAELQQSMPENPPISQRFITDPTLLASNVDTAGSSSQGLILPAEGEDLEFSLELHAQSTPPRASPSVRSAKRASSLGTPSSILSPRPQLLFAIASDEPSMVEQLLSSGQASVDESIGSGQNLLEFTVANENLKNKTEIVKALLKYGADPAPLKASNAHSLSLPDRSPGLIQRLDNGLNPAMKYYLNRPESLDPDSKATLRTLQQSSFAPLVRAKFDIIGQDRVLEEFFRVLGRHGQKKTRNALVILFCGPSGHGKSFLAQKVGTLLNVPTHTINMTALRSQHDLWQCLSTGLEDASPDLDLSDFLIQNQGKRCVVVLDEIEKVDDRKVLNPLLLPWDIGRCSLEQKQHTDTSQTIWIATSNLGQDLIMEHVAQWDHPDTPPSRSEYSRLATAIRRSISEILGASLLSRMTVILPFLPFSDQEKLAIGTEAALSFHQLSGDNPLPAAELESIVKHAVNDVNFVEEEGARSLYRVIEGHMMQM